MHTFGVTPQVTGPMAPRDPFAGPVPMAKVRASPSASLADSVTVSGVSSFVEGDWVCATGGVLTLIATLSVSTPTGPEPLLPRSFVVTVSVVDAAPLKTRPLAAPNVVLSSSRLPCSTTVPDPFPVMFVTPPGTSATVSVPLVTDSVTSRSSAAASTSATETPVIGVFVFGSARTGPVGSVLTGASLIGLTVIETVWVVEVSGGSHAGPGAPQLSGSPRSVTR